MSFIFILFSIWRIVDLVIANIAKLFDIYHEQFHYRYQLYHNNPFIPPFLLSFANYDGANYLHIAHDGYGMYQQAFFPLYPLLVHILAPFFGNEYFLPGFFISNISFLFGFYLFRKYLETIGKKQSKIVWIVLFLLTFPTSFFFGAVYTEGLFFLLVAGGLYFSQKRQYTRMAVFCFLAALTRLMGVFLLIPLFATVMLEQHRFRLLGNTFLEKVTSTFLFFNKQRRLLVLILSPVFGLLCYMFYLDQTVHNPFYFYHALSGFHTGRSVYHVIFLPQVYYRYIHIFFKAPHNFTYFVSILEFVIFNLVFFILLYDLWSLWKKKNTPGRISLLGLNLFSLVNVILPSLTGTMTSFPRYALFSLSFFIRLAEIKNVFIRSSFLILFIIFHIVLLTLFIQGYFIS